MAYKCKSIKHVIQDIESSKVYLPALQRKFVWGKSQIELLFDSIMRNFPIGTFLFWNLSGETANQYVFYEFLREYDQRYPFNKRKLGSFLNPEIVGVLDGQQRLSSMYIGLQGTHIEKAPYMHSSNENAYKKTELYLNLLSLPFIVDPNKNTIETDEDRNFEFRFKTEDETKVPIRKVRQSISDDELEQIIEEPMYWFKVGDILKWNEDPEIDFIIDGFASKCVDIKQIESIKTNKRFIRKALEILLKRITSDQLINYFEVNKNDLEDILKIFIRVNSGGTQLSKTDLLFSTIVATWDDGREEIEALLRKINSKGDGFAFGNEYLMRCCLVLTDAPVLFKVNSFKSENVQKIQGNWAQIANAIEKTVDLLGEYGFSQSLLTSQNSTIIIAYFIYKGGIIDNAAKIEIKKYLIHSLLTGIYGSSQDQLISTLRNSFRKPEKSYDGNYDLNSNRFSFDELLKVELPSRKSLFISESELDNFLSFKKGAASFLILSLLYPYLKYKEVQFHQDHIHPFSGFSKELLKELELSEEEIEEWLHMRDMVPNLQLMEGRQNESKNGSAFIDWLKGKNATEQEYFKRTNYIPLDVELHFKNFKDFFEKRKTKLKDELKKVLSINNKVSVEPDVFSDTSLSDDIDVDDLLGSVNLQ